MILGGFDLRDFGSWWFGGFELWVLFFEVGAGFWGVFLLVGLELVELF